MMSQEQNDLITRIGPKDPCGKLMRMYWQPAALVDELQGPRAVRPVKLLGENLVLFRDEQGRYGLIDRHCAHRGADLAFGRLEHGGLRCAFHGWLFDVDRPMPGNAGRAGGFKTVPGHQAALLSRGREERHSLGLPGRRRAAGVSRARLLHRARQPRLRVQGPLGLQLAAGAGGRHRSLARLLSCIASSRTRTPLPRTRMAASSAARPPAPTCR